MVHDYNIGTPEAVAQRSLGMHAGVVKAVDMFWNGDISGAQAELAPLSGRIPRYGLHLGECYVVGSWISGSKSDSPKALKLLKDTIKLTKSFLDNHPAKAIKEGLLKKDASPTEIEAFALDLKVVIADANFLIATELLRTGSRVKGAWKTRKAWVCYSDLLKKIGPQPAAGSAGAAVIDEVCFGVGTFLLVLSRLPDVVLKMLEIVGFQGNRPLGLEYLTRSFVGGGVNSAFSALLLLINFLVLPRAFSDIEPLLTQADDILRAAFARWPSGAYFHWLASFGDRKRGRNPEAIAHIDAAIRASGKADTSSFAYDRATLIFADLRWQEAITSLEPLCKAGSNEHIPTIILIISACHEMLGHSKESAQWLAKVPTSGVTPKEVNTVELAKICRKRSTGSALVPFELLFVHRDVAHMKPENARQLLEALERMWERKAGDADREERALYALLHAVMVVATGDKKAGEDELRAAIEMAAGNKKEKQVLPFAQFELAELLYRAGDRAGADPLLKACASSADFIFEDTFKTRLRFALDQVKADKGIFSPSASPAPSQTPPISSQTPPAAQ